MKTLETLNLEVLNWITHSNSGTEPTINASRIKQPTKFCSIRIKGIKFQSKMSFNPDLDKQAQEVIISR